MSTHNFTKITIAVGAFYTYQSKKKKLLAGLINRGICKGLIYDRDKL